ncbi:MAG TPA: rod shape-determining protein RodA [Clostridiales bacterium]|nr:rod shape-determining protein RodA [Clostridiales bacterium]
MKNKIFKNMEWWILISAILLCIVGFVALYSASQQLELTYLKRQIIWFVISIVIMIITMFIDYEFLGKISPVFYIIGIISLIAVLFTRSINGANSWFDIGIFSFQPAEIAKISVVLFLASVMVKIQERDKHNINVFWKLLIVLSVVIVPVGLIILQPDYGTAAAYIVATILMLFVSGIDRKYIITAIILVVIAAPLTYKFVLPDHAKRRIDVFLNPESDPKGSGYNVLQSKIAIGAGELTGMGILNGNQTQMGYLSPKTTDFIYSVIGEEMGFVISGAVVIIYVTLITRALYVAKTAKDDLGSYIAAGISGLFLFHMTENLGMTLGLLPITGVPLLFISYGGSSMITSFICIGLLLNISGNRKKTIFIK